MQRDKILLLDGARGQYIPRSFADTIWSHEERARRVSGVSDEQWAILESGPDHEEYWDVWMEVCETAIFTDIFGNKFFIYHDGDCWLIPQGMTWDDEADDWRWPLEEQPK